MSIENQNNVTVIRKEKIVIEKNQLNAKQLEEVNGGTVTQNIYTYWTDYNFSVGEYAGVIGTLYLFIGKTGEADDWVFGKLVNTYEHAWERKRIHDVLIMDGEHAYNRADAFVGPITPLDYGDTLEIYGDDYQMYRKKNL